MRLTLAVVLLCLVSAVPVAAKHWHDDEKHWNMHWNDRDDEDRDGDRHAEHGYFHARDIWIGMRRLHLATT